MSWPSFLYASGPGEVVVLAEPEVGEDVPEVVYRVMLLFAPP